MAAALVSCVTFWVVVQMVVEGHVVTEGKAAPRQAAGHVMKEAKAMSWAAVTEEAKRSTVVAMVRPAGEAVADS